MGRNTDPGRRASRQPGGHDGPVERTQASAKIVEATDPHQTSAEAQTESHDIIVAAPCVPYSCPRPQEAQEPFVRRRIAASSRRTDGIADTSLTGFQPDA